MKYPLNAIRADGKYLRNLIYASLILVFPASRISAEDAAASIRIPVEPLPMDSLALAPRIPIPLSPPAPLAAPPSLSLSMLRIHPMPDSLDEVEKAVAEFPGYWAMVEKENGIDDLRSRLRMPGPGEAPSLWSPLLGATPGGMVFLDLAGIGSSLLNVWRAHEAAQAREERFQAKVRGLIGLTRELQRQNGDSPGISVILAKLDFMGKRVAGKLPKRYDRKIFTENLKAWAVHPAFDTTLVGPRLAELCRAYEEFDP